MNVEELEARVKTLENKVRTLQDIEQINRLQRAYGYYITHALSEDLIDLFSDSPDVNLIIGKGEFKGKEGARRFFSRLNNPKNKYFFHQVMQLSGIVDVAQDRKSAKGRWFGFGPCALPDYDGGTKGWMNGVYENEYVRENDKWKIKKIRWCSFFFPPDEPYRAELQKQNIENIKYIYPDSHFEPDGPPEETVYASGFICPFHFKNPVSGKETIV